MERIMSQEERIRRAEQLYNRRKIVNEVGNGRRKENGSKNNGKNNSKNNGRDNVKNNDENSIENIEIDTLRVKKKMIKKMVLQIIVCATIYITFYLLQNSEYVFSREMIKKTKEIISYDISVDTIINKLNEYCTIWGRRKKCTERKFTGERRK